MKVLVVDANAVMRMITIRAIRRSGFDGELLEAADGQQALDVVRRMRPDIVLCDWHMPGRAGLVLLRSIVGEHLPIRFGFITAEVNDELRAQAIEAGASFLITKPVTLDSFQQLAETGNFVVATGDAGSAAVVPRDPESFGAELQSLLSCLLGRRVTARKKALRPGDRTPGFKGSYRSDEGRICAFFVCDLPLSVYLASALALVPAAAANEVISTATVSDTLVSNLREVLTVCTQTWRIIIPRHLSLAEVTRTSGLPRCRENSQYEVEIVGYGRGRMFAGVVDGKPYG